MPFIEHLFHIDPDAGTGLFEMAILLVVLAIGSLVARRLPIWSDRRRSR